MEKGGKIFQAKGIFTVTKARESSEFRVTLKVTLESMSSINYFHKILYLRFSF